MRKHSPRFGFRLRPLAVLIVLLVCRSAAQAVPAAALTVNNRLLLFDTSAPSVIVSTAQIAGLQTGERILAIDFRPLTAQIYALGSTSRIYTLNPATGAATPVGAGGSFTPALSGNEFGFDFDPFADRIRIVSDTGQNLRLDPTSGAVISADSPLVYAAGDPNAGHTPDVSAIAYTNNFQTATSTTLYGIDWRRAALVRIGSQGGLPVSPDSGQVFTVGSLQVGIQLTELAGFDIAAGGGTAYAALRSADALSSSTLFSVNLSTGAATALGQIGGGQFIRDLTVVERAPDLYAVTPTNKLIRFNSGTPGLILSSIPLRFNASGDSNKTGEQIIGIDFNGGALSALSKSGFFYTVNLLTGEAIAPGSRLSPDLPSGDEFGFSFNPNIPNIAQLVSNTGRNAALFTASPQGLGSRTPLAYASGDPNAGHTPSAVGAAFNFDADGSSMFDIDSSLDLLARQGSKGGSPLAPDSGQLFTIGSLGFDTTNAVGFDINQSPILLPRNNTALRTGSAFAALNAPGETLSRLHLVNLQTGAATPIGAIGGGEIISNLAVVPFFGDFHFDKESYSVGEGDGHVRITVTRTGDTAVEASVEYSTSDNFDANQNADYQIATGTLRFAPGETSKSFDVLITDDNRTHEDSSAVNGETFVVVLSNPTGGFSAFSAANVHILDNDTAEPTTNPIDDAEFFVRQHYRDFLNREPDAAGLAFWTSQITECESRPVAERQGCREVRRINVSAAFFLSIEFQQTGFFVERFYRAAFNRLPTYVEFMHDTQQIGREVVVGTGQWEARLAANRRDYATEFANSKAFKAAFDSLSNAAYVDALFANAGVVPNERERQALIDALDAGTETRAGVLRAVAENEAFRKKESNRAFVAVEYYGYLRRDPDPDGLAFWLSKLNEFGGNYINAEMVKAFITSPEYRFRFSDVE